MNVRFANCSSKFIFIQLIALRMENTQLTETKVRHESQLTNLEQELLDTRNQLADVSSIQEFQIDLITN